MIIFIVLAVMFAAGCVDSENEDTNVSSDGASLDGQENLEQTEYQDLEWAHNAGTHTPVISKDLKNISTAARDLDIYSLSTSSTFLEGHTKVAIEDSDSYVVSPEMQHGKDEYRAGLVDANNAATFYKLAAVYINDGDTVSANKAIIIANDNAKSSGSHFVNASIVINEYSKNHGITTETASNEQGTTKEVSTDTAVCYWDWQYATTSSIGQYHTAPAGYSYVVVQIYLKNNANIPVTTNAYNWKFIADGLQYDSDAATYSEVINHQTIEVGKGGEIETTIVYLVKGNPVEASIDYYDYQYPVFERIQHYTTG